MKRGQAALRIPTVRLREAVFEYVGADGESTIGGWTKIAERLGWESAEVCRDSMRKLLQKEYLEVGGADALGRTVKNRPDYVALIDGLCSAIARPDLAVELLPVDAGRDLVEYADELKFCVVCGRSLHGNIPLALIARAELPASVKPPSRHKRWNVCGPCVVALRPDKFRPGDAGQFSRKIPVADLEQLYRTYCTTDTSCTLLAADAELVERYGFKSLSSAAHCLNAQFVRNGWPVRDRHAGKRAYERGRRRTTVGRWTTDEVRQLHVLHTRGEKLSALELGRRLYERKGYKTPLSCQAAILNAWKHLGLKARDRIEMTVEMSRTNGLSPRNWQERKRLRREAGLTQHGRQRRPECLGTNSRTRLRCTRSSMPSGYCYQHDPDTEHVRNAALSKMRAKSPLHDSARVEPAGELVKALAAFKEGGGTWRELARLADVPESWLSHVAHGKQANVSRDRARAVRRALVPEAVAA